MHLRHLFILAAFFLFSACSSNSRVQQTGQQCLDNVDRLITSDLCIYATKYGGSRPQWDNSGNFRYCVAEAKRRGLSCGVSETGAGTNNSPSSPPVTHICAGDLSKLNDKDMCAYSTKRENSNRVWDYSGEFGKCVNEAKRRGLSCGVRSVASGLNPNSTAAPAPETCFVDPSQCNVEDLCAKATRNYNGQRNWDDLPMYEKYASEAKRRGLTCGVAASSQPSNKTSSCNADPRLCDEKKLCELATRNGKWETLPGYIPHVNEAKRRNLSCNITSDVRPLIQQRSALDEVFEFALDRLNNLGGVSAAGIVSITDVLKRMSKRDYDTLKRTCETAYNDIEPDKCEDRLRALIR